MIIIIIYKQQTNLILVVMLICSSAALINCHGNVFFCYKKVRQRFTLQSSASTSCHVSKKCHLKPSLNAVDESFKGTFSLKIYSTEMCETTWQ